jgi:hypothetical protein
MRALELWLAQRGPTLASTLDSSREPICDMVSTRLANSFPLLCYDPSRTDAVPFQQNTFHETPRRFHRLLLVLLNFQALNVIEREYRWGWSLLQRYGVERYHLLAQVRFYFEAAQANVRLDGEDRAQIERLEAMILRTIERVTLAELSPRRNGHSHGNGVHPH